MQAIVERCCGLDVHQETVGACLVVGSPGAQPTKEVGTFGAVTRDREALGDWRRAAAVTHVGMESTGVYWRPVYAVLSDNALLSPDRALDRLRSCLLGCGGFVQFSSCEVRPAPAQTACRGVLLLNRKWASPQSSSYSPVFAVWPDRRPRRERRCSSRPELPADRASSLDTRGYSSAQASTANAGHA